MASTRPTTRGTVGCPIFGAPALLPLSQLPTKANILRCYQYVRYQLKESAKEPSIAEISKKVSSQVSSIWNQASVPCIADRTIQDHVTRLHGDYRAMMDRFHRIESANTCLDRETLLNDIQEYRQLQEQSLFDVCKCKCATFSACSCAREHKVPAREQSFLLDQRSLRRDYIGAVDRRTTQQLQKREERKRKEEARQLRHQVEQSQSSVVTDFEDEDDDEEEEEEDFEEDDDDWQPDEAQKADEAKSATNFSLFALECDRFGISDRAAALLLNSILVSLGMITSENTTLVRDRAAIGRLRERVRKRMSTQYKEDSGDLVCLFQDAKIDATKVIVHVDGKQQPDVIKEDHYVLVSESPHEPKSSYLGHISIEKREKDDKTMVSSLYILSTFLINFSI
jgi:hypothetical protein